jgi:hypothetical protein
MPAFSEGETLPDGLRRVGSLSCDPLPGLSCSTTSPDQLTQRQRRDSLPPRSRAAQRLLATRSAALVACSPSRDTAARCLPIKPRHSSSLPGHPAPAQRLAACPSSYSVAATAKFGHLQRGHFHRAEQQRSAHCGIRLAARQNPCLLTQCGNLARLSLSAAPFASSLTGSTSPPAGSAHPPLSDLHCAEQQRSGLRRSRPAAACWRNPAAAQRPRQPEPQPAPRRRTQLPRSGPRA